MNNHDIEKKINKAFSSIAPDILESVLADCEKEKGKVIIVPENKKLSSFAKRAAGIAAAAAIVFGGIGGSVVYRSNYAVASVVSLDVNPAVEINVNKKEKVLDVIPLNDDGKLIVGDMDFKGSGVDVAVNALIGSMLRNGYLTDLANSILISVYNDNSEEAALLEERLTAEIESLLSMDGINGAILSQTVNSNAEVSQKADEYGMTKGKAQLIEQITQTNELYKFEDLAAMSINELNILSKDSLESVKSVGQASQKAYIGESKAKEIALNHAGVNSSDAWGLYAEFDMENGVMIYDVDFNANGMEYDYDIDAVTGKILKSSKEFDDDVRPASTTQNNQTSSAGGNTQTNTPQNPTQNTQQNTAQNTQASSVTEARAKEIALNHAGVSASDLRYYTIKTEYDDGVRIYDISFASGEYEYDYDINIATGAILQSEKEYDDDYARFLKNIQSQQKQNTQTQTAQQQTTANTQAQTQAQAPTQTQPAQSTSISESKAKEIALNHAGVSSSDLRYYTSKTEYDDGVRIYDISFGSGEYEYDYEINVATGAILQSEKDYDDDYARMNRAYSENTQNTQTAQNTQTQAQAPTQTQPAQSTSISESKAKEIALSHAGVSSSDLRYYTINAEYDDGIRIYDISFASGDYEYDYDINVATGAVLQSEKDYDDDYARMNRASAATGQSTNVQSANPSAVSTPEPVQPEPVQQAPAQNTRDSYIGEASAKEIAFSHAGVSSGNVSGVSIEFDMERGGKYEVDFRSGGYEYSYEINAQTGSVIDYEKEYDD